MPHRQRKIILANNIIQYLKFHNPIKSWFIKLSPDLFDIAVNTYTYHIVEVKMLWRKFYVVFSNTWWDLVSVSHFSPHQIHILCLFFAHRSIQWKTRKRKKKRKWKRVRKRRRRKPRKRKMQRKMHLVTALKYALGCFHIMFTFYCHI